MGSLLALFVFRARLLACLILIGCSFGDRLARLLRIDWLAQKFHDFTDTLGHKLNRESRSVATRVYRGIIALVVLEIPALALAAILQQHANVTELLAVIAIVTLLGRGFATSTMADQLKQARAGTLTLEQDDNLFADTHGVLRYLIERSAERFATRIIGAGFWFVLAGMPGMFAYLVLALAASHYSPLRPENAAFGWAAEHLYRVADMPPRIISSLLLLIAGTVVAKTHPVAALRSLFHGEHRWLTMVAELMGVALGGKIVTPAGAVELPWQGTGTAQLTASHLAVWIGVLIAATLLWLLSLLALSLV